MREVEYAKPLDADFKKYLAQKQQGKTAKEKMDHRAGDLLSEDLVEEAKRYGYICISSNKMIKIISYFGYISDFRFLIGHS